MSEATQSTNVVRFGVFEADLRTAELRKQGVRIRLPGQSFQVLEAMLLRPGELVTREELKQKLWPSDSFGDFEHGLNAAINRVREALGDSSDNPRFIETLPRRGYRFIAPIQYPVQQAEADIPAETPSSQNQRAPSASGLRHYRLGIAGAVIGVLLLALLITWWRIPTAVPVVESIRQLTDDREPKAHAMVSDGSRIYFNEGTPQHFSLAQVSVAGGLTAPVETRLANAYVLGIANDGSSLTVLVPSAPEIYPGDSLWSVPLPAGEPRRLISGEVWNATNLPDGRIVFATTVFGKDPKGTDSRTDWFIAVNDGSNPRKLVSLPGYAGESVNASPDGRRILISQVIFGQSQRLFEIAVDGTGLREIRQLNEDECCFAWSPDEKYLIYQSGHAPHSDIWALPVNAGLFRHPGTPIRLTNGPLPYSTAHPSRDGKQIFVIGTKQRGELVRYDMKSHGFVPFLSGISATDPTFSQDGKWVAYASYPDGSVWRSRTDGSERIQLTYPPITALFPAISPDGAKVSYHTDKDELFVVSTEGGPPKKLDDNANYADWSPDGNYLLYQQNTPGPKQIIDVRTGKKSAVPSSEHVDSGFWLSQDILVVRNGEHTNFMTFNLKNQKWTELTPGGLGDVEDWMMSPDRKYLYFITGGAEPKTMRLRVSDNQLETITSLKDLHRAVTYVGDYGLTQINVAPDGSPVFTRDIGYDELYALNVRWP